MTVKQKLQSLINTANSTTGKSATDLTTAIGQLIEGYGGGGGDVPLFTDIETGIWIPASDVANTGVYFAKTHSNPPVIVIMCDAENNDDVTTYTNYSLEIIDFASLLSATIPYTTSYSLTASVFARYRTTSTSSSTSTSASVRYGRDVAESNNTSYYRFWANSERFQVSTINPSRYWRAGRKYNWMALWID